MESAKDATNAVKNMVNSKARKGDEKLFSAENKPQEKVADKEPEKAENAENDTPAMERAKSLVDNLGKLGTSTQRAPY